MSDHSAAIRFLSCPFCGVGENARLARPHECVSRGECEICRTDRVFGDMVFGCRRRKRRRDKNRRKFRDARSGM